jgi:hypothetical protein
MSDCKYCWQRSIKKDTPHRHDCAGLEIELLTDQVIVDTGIIKSHHSRIVILESVLGNVLDICKTELAPAHDKQH